jgi:hypothetical protein
MFFTSIVQNCFTEISPTILDAMKLDLLGRKLETYTEGSNRMKQLELPMQRGSS